METVKYKTYKTTMGHKIRVRMTRQEIRENIRIIRRMEVGYPPKRRRNR